MSRLRTIAAIPAGSWTKWVVVGFWVVVLAGTFAVLATIPSTTLTEIGFAVAFGILLDTIVVRSVLVTALNLDLGRWMWWPSTLARTPEPAPAELGQERAAALVAGGTS